MKILKVSTSFNTSPPTNICNKSLSSGIFPSWLKFSEIKKERTDITNFRPISLLTSFSKILEKVTPIYQRLYQHINQNNILATKQYGFRNNSTEKASFKLINEILPALNNKLTVGEIFCDLEKAFNFTNHEFYGLRGKTKALLLSSSRKLDILFR